MIAKLKMYKIEYKNLNMNAKIIQFYVIRSFFISFLLLRLNIVLKVDLFGLITSHVTVAKSIDNILIKSLNFFELQNNLTGSLNDHSFSC